MNLCKSDFNGARLIGVNTAHKWNTHLLLNVSVNLNYKHLVFEEEKLSDWVHRMPFGSIDFDSPIASFIIICIQISWLNLKSILKFLCAGLICSFQSISFQFTTQSFTYKYSAGNFFPSDHLVNHKKRSAFSYWFIMCPIKSNHFINSISIYRIFIARECNNCAIDNHHRQS